MLGVTNTLLLSSDENSPALAVCQQAAGSRTRVCLSDFLSNPQHSSVSVEKIYLSLSTHQKEAAATAAAKLLSALRADGILIVAVEGAEGLETLSSLGRSFLYAGFISVDNKELPQELLDSVDRHQGVQLGAWKRPKWAIGASTSVSSKEDGLVDEDSLIDPQETYKSLAKGRSDCASRPRACANCTCGRKEAEEAADKEAFRKQLESGAVRSSCGNCYLGDAFRCAGCPYRGLPAFRPGEKVDLSAEAQNAVAAATALADAAADVQAAGVNVDKGSNKVTLISLDDN